MVRIAEPIDSGWGLSDEGSDGQKLQTSCAKVRAAEKNGVVTPTAVKKTDVLRVPASKRSPAGTRDRFIVNEHCRNSVTVPEHNRTVSAPEVSPSKPPSSSIRKQTSDPARLTRSEVANGMDTLASLEHLMELAAEAGSATHEQSLREHDSLVMISKILSSHNMQGISNQSRVALAELLAARDTQPSLARKMSPITSSCLRSNAKERSRTALGKLADTRSDVPLGSKERSLVLTSSITRIEPVQREDTDCRKRPKVAGENDLGLASVSRLGVPTLSVGQTSLSNSFRSTSLKSPKVVPATVLSGRASSQGAPRSHQPRNTSGSDSHRSLTWNDDPPGINLPHRPTRKRNDKPLTSLEQEVVDAPRSTAVAGSETDLTFGEKCLTTADSCHKVSDSSLAPVSSRFLHCNQGQVNDIQSELSGSTRCIFALRATGSHRQSDISRTDIVELGKHDLEVLKVCCSSDTEGLSAPQASPSEVGAATPVPVGFISDSGTNMNAPRVSTVSKKLGSFSGNAIDVGISYDSYVKKACGSGGMSLLPNSGQSRFPDGCRVQQDILLSPRAKLTMQVPELNAVLGPKQTEDRTKKIMACTKGFLREANMKVAHRGIYSIDSRPVELTQGRKGLPSSTAVYAGWSTSENRKPPECLTVSVPQRRRSFGGRILQFVVFATAGAAVVLFGGELLRRENALNDGSSDDDVSQ